MKVDRYSTGLRKLTLSLVTCLMITLLAALCSARFEQDRAVKLIGLLSSVTPGITSQVSLRSILANEAYSTGSSNVCAKFGMGDCDQFGFSNKWLAFLHISRAKIVIITLDYQGGVLSGKSIQFIEEPRITAVVKQAVNIDKTLFGESVPSSRHVSVDISSIQRAIVKVYDDQDVPEDQRRRDWQVNLSCLYRIGACVDPRKILSGAFSKNLAQ